MATTPNTLPTTPMQTPQGADGLRLHAPITRLPGGFWRRLVAVIVDGAIVSVITMPLQVVLGALMGFGAPLSGDALQANNGFLALTYGGSYVISLGTLFFYYGWFYKTKGATPGKMAQNERSCHQRKTSLATHLISVSYAAINGIRLCMSNSNVPYGLIWA